MPLPPAEVGQISEELELREEQEGPGEESFREAPPPRRRHIPLSHRTSLKVLAFVLCVLSILTAALSAFGAVMIAEEDLYTIPQETYLEDTLQNLATGDSYQLVRALLRGEEDPASFLLRGKNIRSVSVRFPEGGPMADWSWGDLPAAGSRPSGTGLRSTAACIWTGRTRCARPRHCWKPGPRQKTSSIRTPAPFLPPKRPQARKARPLPARLPRRSRSCLSP